MNTLSYPPVYVNGTPFCHVITGNEFHLRHTLLTCGHQRFYLVASSSMAWRAAVLSRWWCATAAMSRCERSPSGLFDKIKLSSLLMQVLLPTDRLIMKFQPLHVVPLNKDPSNEYCRWFPTDLISIWGFSFCVAIVVSLFDDDWRSKTKIEHWDETRRNSASYGFKQVMETSGLKIQKTWRFKPVRILFIA